MNKEIEIPFGAKDSELRGWEYTIPKGMEAEIKDGKIIVREKESEDEWMINELQGFLSSYGSDYFGTGEWQKFDDWLEKQKEQKPAEWSEKEHKLLNYAISLTDDAEVKTFLESLRNQPKQKWSEEDEDNLHRVIRVLEDNDSDWEELSNWLKSLKNRGSSPKSNTNPPHWKPSEEQIEALKETIEHLRLALPECYTTITELENLEAELKSL